MNQKLLFNFSDHERELVMEAQMAMHRTLDIIMRLRGFKGVQAQLLPDGSGMATLEPMPPPMPIPPPRTAE